MSLWIETPSVLDKATGELLLSFKDSHWSLDAARWVSDSTVELTLRKYPGNHLPAQVVATQPAMTEVDQSPVVEPTAVHEASRG